MYTRADQAKIIGLAAGCRDGLAESSVLEAFRAFPREKRSVQVKISTRHGHLSKESQENISAKAEKLLRIFDRITAIELTIDLEDSNSPRVDAKLSAEHKHDFVAHAASDNLMGSIDTVLHRLEQQLRKYKEKVQERHRDHDAKRQSAVSGDETTAG